MIRPEEDRLEYGNELIPPAGFRFVRAVATTYSLDFETLIAVLVPLALGGGIDDRELVSNPIAILQAIRKVVGRLVIFCEAGEIKAPSTNNRLAALLDDIVVQVALPRCRGRFPSFHPKTWLIEYENAEGRRRWRFIVLSRNLTGDHSWDVAASFEGERRTGSYGATKDLLPFFEYLRGRVRKGAGSDAQRKVVCDAIASLRGVSFFCAAPFDGFDILPTGIDRNASSVDLFSRFEPFDDLVVISPFLTPKLIRKLNGARGEPKERKRILISRADALGSLTTDDADKFKKYVLRMPRTESNEEHDLHAKMYLRRRGSRTELWLGSANATESASSRNVEMMVCLHCYNRHLNADKLMSDICGGDVDGKTSPLEEVADVTEYECEVSEEEKERREAEEKIKEICRLKMTGRAVQDGGRYRMSLVFSERIAMPDVTVRPVNSCGNEIGLCCNRELAFPEPMPVEDLSSLFVFSVRYADGAVRRVVKAPVSGIPETRNDAVVNRMAKDRSALLKYLAMLVSPNPALSLRKMEEAAAFVAAGAQHLQTSIMPSLYEDMLLAASDSPERIREIGEVLGAIRGDDELLSMYGKVFDRFAEALGLKTGKGVAHE